MQQSAQEALRQAAEVVGLKAAALYLFDKDGARSMSLSTAENDELQEKLASLEETLFDNLRKERQLWSAYLTFGGNPPIHSFTQPLRQAENVFGAIIGLQVGERTIVSEDDFLEALAAAVALNVLASGQVPGDASLSPDAVEKERMGAIMETAVTVNHEINNPLTAILGNVQLLLMRQEDLDEKTIEKLRVVEASALKIRDITQRLLNLSSVRSVKYVDGTSMLHIPRDDDEQEGSDTE